MIIWFLVVMSIVVKLVLVSSVGIMCMFVKVLMRRCLLLCVSSVMLFLVC